MVAGVARARWNDWRTIERRLAEYRMLRGEVETIERDLARAREETEPAPNGAHRRPGEFTRRLDGERPALIRALNDRLRTKGEGGQVLITQGLSAIAQARGDLLFVDRVLKAVAAFDTFTGDNDPHGEHDYGSVEVESVRILWKIDPYDASLRSRSPDPADPDVTIRVLTIMLPEEY